MWERPGEDVGLIQGTSDYAVGKVRVSFLVVRSDGKLVERPRARVWLARGLDAAPMQEREATLQPVGSERSESAAGDVRYLFVTHFDIAEPGKYAFVAEPIGGYRIQGVGTITVKKTSASPAVGEPAPRSRTPTLASTGGSLERLSTSTQPDPELYRVSVADAVAAKAPFVVVFATPKFCKSRACGPVVDVVEDVSRDVAEKGVRFIHVEVYEDNDPQKGVNRWMKEWNLPSEPWVFVVGDDGLIKAKFEGSASADELERAVAAVA